MRALVVYESMFGNTQQVAESIAEGLRQYLETDVLDVASEPSAQAGEYDVIVVGAPTHAFTLSSPRTRRDAWLRGARAGVMRTGIREWLEGLTPPHAGLMAAFDTRSRVVRALPGSAARAITRRLRRKGAPSVHLPASFYVTSERGPLVPGELDRAHSWGVALAILAGATPRISSPADSEAEHDVTPVREVGSQS